MRLFYTLVLVASLVLSTAARAEEMVSGPQAGEKLPGAFHPLNVNGPDAGKKACQVCKNENNPVVMILAREIDPAVTTLLKKLDDETRKQRGMHMGSFAVFCNSEESLENKLRTLAEKQEIFTTILTIDNPVGPAGYKFHKDAAVTVILYNERSIEANLTFAKGKLDDKAIDAIFAALPKILKKADPAVKK